MFALSSGGSEQTWQDTVGVESSAGAGAETYFSEDHHISYQLFGLIVGGLNIRVFEEGKQAKVFLFGVEQSFSERFGLIITKRAGTYCV
jgi:hypothetical protein